MTAVDVDGSGECLQRLKAMLASEELSDLTVKVGHQKFRCHKLLLCAGSDVLKV